MSIETQTFADLMALGMTDEALLQSIEYHLDKYEEGLMEHAQVASELITALDNVYGGAATPSTKQMALCRANNERLHRLIAELRQQLVAFFAILVCCDDSQVELTMQSTYDLAG